MQRSFNKPDYCISSSALRRDTSSLRQKCFFCTPYNYPLRHAIIHLLAKIKRSSKCASGHLNFQLQKCAYNGYCYEKNRQVSQHFHRYISDKHLYISYLKFNYICTCIRDTIHCKIN